MGVVFAYRFHSAYIINEITDKPIKKYFVFFLFTLTAVITATNVINNIITVVLMLNFSLVNS
ncbi:hypothetical protein D3C76_1467510 [compost metagenome]